MMGILLIILCLLGTGIPISVLAAVDEVVSEPTIFTTNVTNIAENVDGKFNLKIQYFLELRSSIGLVLFPQCI